MNLPTTRRKLIEVALPLDAINKASAKEKSIRHGHPSTLHLWWARRPLAAARAVIFAQMVDDPSACPEEFPTTEEQDQERERLFRLIEELVLWKSTTNEAVLQRARDEIRRSWRRTCKDNADHPRAAELFDPGKLPAFHDPFAGGGALPLEAQRLGLEAHASDLNPVAVLINKAMIEIPPKFAGRPPANPLSRADMAGESEWPGASGLAADVRYYGKWTRDEAEKRIGHLYPKVEVTAGLVRERPELKPYEGRKLTVIAWLWARTVKSPNPAFADVDVPLASTFMLATKKGKEAYVEPVIEARGYKFTVKVGTPSDVGAAKRGTTAGKRRAFRCLMSDVPVTYDYIRAVGRTAGLGARLMAIVAEGDRERVYLAPTPRHESVACNVTAEWAPEMQLPNNPRDFKTPNYGLPTLGDLFTPRQLVALTTFSDLVVEATERVRCDAETAGLPADDRLLQDGGTGATAYAEAVGVYLAMALSRSADRGSTICSWDNSPKMEALRNTFGRQAIPMVWDFAEGNTFCDSSGNWLNNIRWIAKTHLEFPRKGIGTATQVDAVNQMTSENKVVSTDPPYYDNVGYADLSDFFYVWLRRTLKPVFPGLFATLAVPKAQELVASPYRHGSREAAETFFLAGMRRALGNLAEQAHTGFPVTVYYAFKQAESKRDGVSSTGWETFLDAVIHSGFTISGTWPVRTELANKLLANNANILASSIVIVCRKRSKDAPLATRREFVAALKTELPEALADLRSGNIAPVDLAQAVIGPGMAVYTRYTSVLDAQSQPVAVSQALALINQTLDEVLAEQEGDFDADTRWALAWFEQHGFSASEFGSAETLSKAKNTSIGGLVEAGILESKAGDVRLLGPDELPADWNPATDSRLTIWEAVHHLIRELDAGGEVAAAGLVRRLGGVAYTARELAYRLYALAERGNRAAEALSYNSLIQSWPEIARLAQSDTLDTEPEDMLSRLEGQPT